MGVKGLNSFLLSLVSSLVDQLQPDEDRRVILVDALSVFLSFFNFSWKRTIFCEDEETAGGSGEGGGREPQKRASTNLAFEHILTDYGEFYVWICRLHMAFEANGFEMRYYFDNEDPTGDEFAQDKHGTRMRRHKERVKALQQVEAVLSYGILSPKKWKAFSQGLQGFTGNLAYDQLLDTLKHLKANIVQCVGEADHHLIKDSRDPSVFVVLGNDSDFFVAQGVRYLPVGSLRIYQQSKEDPPSLYGVVFDNNLVANLLEFNASSSFDYLAELAFLIGNDYSLPFVEQEVHSIISNTIPLDMHDEPWIKQVVHFRVVQHADVALEDIPDFGPLFRDRSVAQEFTRLLAICRKSATGVHNNQPERPQALLNLLQKGVSSTLSIYDIGESLERIPIEHIYCTASAALITRPISCALYSLFGRRSIKQYLRQNISYEEKNVDVSGICWLNHDILKYPKLSKVKGVSFLLRPLQTWACYKNVMAMSAEQMSFGTMRLAVLLCKYLNGATHCLKYTLPDCWIDALLQTTLWLNVIDQLFPFDKEKPLLKLPQVTTSLPDMELVSIVSWYEQCYAEFCMLGRCVLSATQFQEWFPSPHKFFNPRLFALLMQLHEECVLNKQCCNRVTAEMIVNMFKEEILHFADPITNCPLETPMEDLRELAVSIPEAFLVARQQVNEGFTEIKREGRDQPEPPIQRIGLPVDAHREEIIQSLHENFLTLVIGETGCGKSSRIPLMILEAHKKDCFIIVTQPRRIAAVSLAQRVAKELGEQVGKTVGYCIKGANKSRRMVTKILFVTTGWLLHRLLSSPSYFKNITHFILDEVHERSLDGDILSLLLKKLTLHSHIQSHKLLIMSARFDAAMFANYFELPDRAQNAEPIFVGQSRYPVRIYHSEDLRTFPEFKRDFPAHLLKKEAVVELLAFVCERLVDSFCRAQGYNTILAFLPGVLEIEKAEEQLLSRCRAFISDKELQILLLHGSMETHEQEEIYKALPSGCQVRIILATNVAESSITIPQLTYVIDTGLHKQVSYSDTVRGDCLATLPISQSSAIQRAGRVGRTCQGTVFRLYSKQDYKQLLIDTKPEILRRSLTSTVLDLKVLEEDVPGGYQLIGRPSEALSDTIQPPNVDNIKVAYADLLDMTALYYAEGDIWDTKPLDMDIQDLDLSVLSPFGRLAALLPLDLSLALFVAYCALCGDLLPIGLVMALGVRCNVFLHARSRAPDASSMTAAVCRGRMCFDDNFHSDLIAIVNLVHDYSGLHDHEAAQFCHRWGLKKAQLDKLIDNIGDLARKLLPVLPNHKEHLHQLMKLKIRQPKCLALRQTPADRRKVDVLIVLLSIACKDRIVYHPPEQQDKRVEFNIKRHGLPITEELDPLCTAILTELPAKYLELDWVTLLGLDPDSTQLQKLISPPIEKRIPVVAPPTRQLFDLTEKEKEHAQDILREASEKEKDMDSPPQKKEQEEKICLVYDLALRFLPNATNKVPEWEFNYAPLGINVLRALCQKGTLFLDENFLGTYDKPRWLKERERKLTKEEEKLLPQCKVVLPGYMRWKTRTKRGVNIGESSTILSYLIQKEPTQAFAVAAYFLHHPNNPSPHAFDLTLIPEWLAPIVLGFAAAYSLPKDEEVRTIFMDENFYFILPYALSIETVNEIYCLREILDSAVGTTAFEKSQGWRYLVFTRILELLQGASEAFKAAGSEVEDETIRDLYWDAEDVSGDEEEEQKEKQYEEKQQPNRKQAKFALWLSKFKPGMSVMMRRKKSSVSGIVQSVGPGLVIKWNGVKRTKMYQSVSARISIPDIKPEETKKEVNNEKVNIESQLEQDKEKVKEEDEENKLF